MVIVHQQPAAEPRGSWPPSPPAPVPFSSVFAPLPLIPLGSLVLLPGTHLPGPASPHFWPPAPGSWLPSTRPPAPQHPAPGTPAPSPPVPSHAPAQRPCTPPAMALPRSPGPRAGRARSPGLAVKLVSAALGSATPSVPRGSEHTGTLGSSPRAQGTRGTAAWRCRPRAVWSGRASFLAAGPGGAV